MPYVNLGAIEEGPVCPNCKEPTVKRKSRYGSFFGCRNYPQCRYTVRPLYGIDPNSDQDVEYSWQHATRDTIKSLLGGWR